MIRTILIHFYQENSNSMDLFLLPTICIFRSIGQEVGVIVRELRIACWQ